MKYDNSNNQDAIRMPLPEGEKELFAIVERKLGGSRMNVSCEDGKSRLARIPGGKKRSIKKLKTGDLVVVSPWDVQDEKADIIYKYRRNQARFLSRKNILPDVIDVF